VKSCEWCHLTGETAKWLLFETPFWQVFLSDCQDYVGRCILVCKRHCKALSDLTQEEWIELKEITDRLERYFCTQLGAALCNWSCLMNSFYKEDDPMPHLHIHVRPRYDKPVILNGSTYTDSEFGHHYALNKSGTIPAEDREEVFIRLKEWLNR